MQYCKHFQTSVDLSLRDLCTEIARRDPSQDTLSQQPIWGDKFVGRHELTKREIVESHLRQHGAMVHLPRCARVNWDRVAVSLWNASLAGIVSSWRYSSEAKHFINTMTLFANVLVTHGDSMWFYMILGVVSVFLFCKFALQESAAPTPRLYLWCSFCNTVHRSESCSSSPFLPGWASRKPFEWYRKGGAFVGFWCTKACMGRTFWKLPTCGPIFLCTKCKRKPQKKKKKSMQPGSAERTNADWQPGRMSLSITQNILMVASLEERTCRAQPATLRGLCLQFFPYGSNGSLTRLARQLCQRHARDLLKSHFFGRNQTCVLFISHLFSWCCGSLELPLMVVLELRWLVSWGWRCIQSHPEPSRA